MRLQKNRFSRTVLEFDILIVFSLNVYQLNVVLIYVYSVETGESLRLKR